MNKVLFGVLVFVKAKIQFIKDLKYLVSTRIPEVMSYSHFPANAFLLHEMVGNSFSYVFRADGVLGAVIAGAGMVVVGGTVLAVAGAAALVGILTKKK